jgi:hypothetical protein
VDSEPHFGSKLKAIREKKGRFFVRKSVVGFGRMIREKLGVFPGNLAYYAEGRVGSGYLLSSGSYA